VKRPRVTGFRMADYGQFAHVVAAAIGFKSDVENVLQRVTLTQTEFAMENEPLFDLLDDWKRADPVRAKQWISTGALYWSLVTMTSQTKDIFKTSQAFGHKLDDYRATLERVFQMEVEVRRSRRKWVRFGADGPDDEPPDAGDEEIGPEPPDDEK